MFFSWTPCSLLLKLNGKLIHKSINGRLAEKAWFLIYLVTTIETASFPRSHDKWSWFNMWIHKNDAFTSLCTTKLVGVYGNTKIRKEPLAPDWNCLPAKKIKYGRNLRLPQTLLKSLPPQFLPTKTTIKFLSVTLCPCLALSLPCVAPMECHAPSS